MRSLIALALLGLPASAWAYNFTGGAWAPDSQPLKWYQSSYIEDSLPTSADGATGPHGDPMVYQEEVIIKAYCNWKWLPYCDEMLPGWGRNADFAECAEVDFEYLGWYDDFSGANVDGVNIVYWDDPADDQASGINAYSVCPTRSILYKELDGEFIYEISECDLVFNNDIDWGTDEEIDANCVGDHRSVESTATHEVGHNWGMGHSCEQDETCLDTTFQEATMYWSGPTCDTSRSSPNSDDLAGITALYGPNVDYDMSPEFGAVPLETQVTLSGDANVLAAEWNFGDGTTSTELEPSHTYETEGQFTISVDFTVESEECGEDVVEQRDVAKILACGLPKPTFSVERISGLEYQIVNMTDITTFGCIDALEWEIYAGGSATGEPIAVLGAWSPKFNFPDLGTYTVHANMAGPAGGSGAELTFEIASSGGFGCAAVPNGAAGGLAGLLLAGAALARRRD